MQKPVAARELICEFVGTFALLVVILGVTSANQAPGGGMGILGAALAIGLTIAVFATACAPISGGQFNPSVTIALLAVGKMRPAAAIAYILAQLGGASAGAYMGSYLMTAPLASPVIHAAVPAIAKGYHPGQAYLCEIVLTFFLMFVIYGTAVSENFVQKSGALFIGLTVTLCILAGSHISGSVMNPAVYFGISAASGNFLTDGALVYTIGPVIGALMASVLWAYVIEE